MHGPGIRPRTEQPGLTQTRRTPTFVLLERLFRAAPARRYVEMHMIRPHVHSVDVPTSMLRVISNHLSNDTALRVTQMEWLVLE